MEVWAGARCCTEGGVQSAAVYLDEGHDVKVELLPVDDSKDREQQDMLQLVELTLGPAGSGMAAAAAEQLIERSRPARTFWRFGARSRSEESAAPESATWDCWDDLRNVLRRGLNLSAQPV